MGAVVVLADQDRRMVDRLLIARGEAALRRVDELSATRGPYALQAAIALCHARAFRSEETKLGRGGGARRGAVSIMPSPIVELNRAVAIDGVRSGCRLTAGRAARRALRLERYHLLHAVQGDLLEKLGMPRRGRGRLWTWCGSSNSP